MYAVFNYFFLTNISYIVLRLYTHDYEINKPSVRRIVRKKKKRDVLCAIGRQLL